MKRLFQVIAITFLAMSISGCDKESGFFKKDTEFQKEMPDFGGIKVIEVEAQGYGASRNAAILDAINIALKQTNASPVVGVTINSDGTLSVPGESGTFGFTNETVVSITAGSIQGFEILSEQEQRNPSRWTVKLNVKVNKYEGSADTKLPKVAIAFPRASQSSYTIGDEVLSADQAANAIRGVIGESIRKSNRFFVINRDFDAEINEELAQIGGSSNPAELAKLGQRLTADILVIPEINSLQYRKSTRLLRFSGRELNSYSGSVSVNFNVINVVTGQLILTERFSANFPSTPPSVYGTQRVGVASVNAYLADMSEQFTRKFILKNFPVSVIKLDGKTVVLSQGEGILKAGSIYNAVSLGEDIKDPQTGQSLGRLETKIGTVKVINVNQKLSIGILTSSFDPAKFKPGIIELRENITSANSEGVSVPSEGTSVSQTPSAASPRTTTPRQKPSSRPRDNFDEPFEF
jgi:curli biogenesis system outer membrane secretion channel CsgG